MKPTISLIEDLENYIHVRIKFDKIIINHLIFNIKVQDERIFFIFYFLKWQ